MEAWLETAVAFAVAVWIGGNLLSACDAFRPTVLRGAWALAGSVALMALWRTRAARTRWPKPVTASEWALGVAIGALLAVTLVRAVLAPPNTVDVLNYHLPRQLMWLQNGSLAPFLTVNDRMNMMPPLAEVIGAQFLALTGGDRWANLPQWAAYAGLAAGLVVLVRRLGGSRGAAGVAALLGLLLPMAYHEATNAKNDLLSAFWIAAGAAELLRWRAEGFVATRWAAVRLAAPFALAWLTKSTAMLFVPPLLIAGLWPWLRRAAWSERTRVLLPATLFALLMVAPFHARNLAWYGTPLGRHRAEDGGQQAAEAFGPRLFVSNAVRQASLHVVSPAPAWNNAVISAVRAVHRWLGIDVDDRRTTLWILTFDAPYLPDDETIAGAPVHFLLGLPLLVALVCGWSAGGARERVRWLAFAALAGAALFCACLKWQPWATRLEQPIFMLGIAAAVVAGETWARRRAALLGTGVVLLAVIAWWPGADTVGRTLWRHPRLTEMSREVNYYRMLPRLAFRDRTFVDLIARSGARRIWFQNIHDIAYPLMHGLQQRVPALVFLGASATELQQADAIVALSVGATMPLYADFGGRTDWRLVGGGFGDGIFLPQARVRALGWENTVPQFAGWSKHLGLALTEADEPGLGRALVRGIPSGRAELFYEARGRPMRLRAAVRQLGGTARPWTLTVAAAGKDFATVELQDGAAREFEVQLPSAPGARSIELRVPAAVAPDVIFTRLQIVDTL